MWAPRSSFPVLLTTPWKHNFDLPQKFILFSFYVEISRIFLDSTDLMFFSAKIQWIIYWPYRTHRSVPNTLAYNLLERDFRFSSFITFFLQMKILSITINLVNVLYFNRKDLATKTVNRGQVTNLTTKRTVIF